MTSWIIRSAGTQIAETSPDLAIVRLPYLGQVARRYGPDGREAGRSVASINAMLNPFLDELPEGTAVLAVTESIVTPVTATIYPNRILREMGLLKLGPLPSGGIGPDLAGSAAFAVADHQLCHIYLNDPGVIGSVASIFSGDRSEGVGTVVASAEQRAQLGLDHERAGEVVLVACPEAWFAPNWWQSDAEVPADPVRVGAPDRHRGRIEARSRERLRIAGGPSPQRLLSRRPDLLRGRPPARIVGDHRLEHRGHPDRQRTPRGLRSVTPDARSPRPSPRTRTVGTGRRIGAGSRRRRSGSSRHRGLGTASRR